MENNFELIKELEMEKLQWLEEKELEWNREKEKLKKELQLDYENKLKEQELRIKAELNKKFELQKLDFAKKIEIHIINNISDCFEMDMLGLFHVQTPTTPHIVVYSIKAGKNDRINLIREYCVFKCLVPDPKKIRHSFKKILMENYSDRVQMNYFTIIQNIPMNIQNNVKMLSVQTMINLLRDLIRPEMKKLTNVVYNKTQSISTFHNQHHHLIEKSISLN